MLTQAIPIGSQGFRTLFVNVCTSQTTCGFTFIKHSCSKFFPICLRSFFHSRVSSGELFTKLFASVAKTAGLKKSLSFSSMPTLIHCERVAGLVLHDCFYVGQWELAHVQTEEAKCRITNTKSRNTTALQAHLRATKCLENDMSKISLHNV